MLSSLWSRLKRPVEILSSVAFFALLVLVLLRLAPQLGAALNLGGEDTEVAGWEIQTLEGTTLTQRDLAGKVVLVNVWATWCTPCVIEMPGFQRIYEDYKGQGFMVLGISRDRAGEAHVKAFLREKGITYPVAMSENADMGGLDEVRSLPTSYLLGRDGHIKHRVVGLFAPPVLRLAVKNQLK
jgi:thiol-disulfide isomerase/thioredoxin